MVIRIKRFGWIPDLPDYRDLMYSAPTDVVTSLPASVDLRSKCPPVYDQGQLGSGPANAVAAAIEFDLTKANENIFVPSRLFIYFNQRAIEGTTNCDSGAQIRDGFKSVAGEGDVPENLLPYDISKFTEKPPQKAYDNVMEHKALVYQRIIRDLNQMKGCLASGYPFVFGFAAYEGFQSTQVAETGQARMPSPGEQVIGGQAVLAVGYDDLNYSFIVRNSWGTNWGMKGYFTLPYTYLLNENLSDDFWTVRLVA